MSIQVDVDTKVKAYQQIANTDYNNKRHPLDSKILFRVHKAQYSNGYRDRLFVHIGIYSP